MGLRATQTNGRGQQADKQASQVADSWMERRTNGWIDSWTIVWLAACAAGEALAHSRLSICHVIVLLELPYCVLVCYKLSDSR